MSPVAGIGMLIRHPQWIYKSVLRRLLFCVPPETAHHVTLRACQVAGRVPGLPRLTRSVFEFQAEELAVEVAGMTFPNPIGLAAGWDKDGLALKMIDHLGFGFTEIGSVSASPSIGNAKPRLFRVPCERAIVVNYGLPNDGADRIARRLAKVGPRVPRGVNLVTTNRGADAAAATADEIFDDYAASVSLVQSHASYLTLNLSCPNAKDGKDFFATVGNIRELLSRLSACGVSVPVFLKMPPSELASDHDRWLAEADAFPFVGGFLFNLAPRKPNGSRQQLSHEMMPGAVAGRPVREQHNRCIASLYSRMDRSRYTIIGGGGVFSADDAWKKIQLGASLVQIYSGLIYEGPFVTRRINEGILNRLRQGGFRNLSEAVGSGNVDAKHLSD